VELYLHSPIRHIGLMLNELEEQLCPFAFSPSSALLYAVSEQVAFKD
jgi:hypothetical protein